MCALCNRASGAYGVSFGHPEVGSIAATGYDFPTVRAAVLAALLVMVNPSGAEAVGVDWFMEHPIGSALVDSLDDAHAEVYEESGVGFVMKPL